MGQGHKNIFKKKLGDGRESRVHCNVRKRKKCGVDMGIRSHIVDRPCDITFRDVLLHWVDQACFHLYSFL